MKRILILLVLVSTIFACREDYSIDLPAEDASLNLFAELSPGHPVAISLFASQPFGKGNELVVPEDAVVKLMGTDMAGTSNGFIFDRDLATYRFENFKFTPQERNFYEVVAYLPGDDADTLRSRTYLPPASSLGLIEVLSNEKLDMGNDRFNHEILLRINIPAPAERPAYYQLIPRRVKSEFRIDQAGNVIVTDSPEKEVADIRSILNNKNAISELTHKEGFFIDYSRINDDFVDIRFVSRSNLLSFKDVFRAVQIELRTLSSELFSYHQQLHRRLVSNQTDFSYPVGSFSNVENGKGVFGAYSMTFSTVILK